MLAIGDQKLTYSELQAVFYESANVVNERPIGTTPKSIEDGSYICPTCYWADLVIRFQPEISIKQLTVVDEFTLFNV